MTHTKGINSIKQITCTYCHTDSGGYVKPIEQNGHAFVYRSLLGWRLELKAKGWRGAAKIYYCPICGRKLDDATEGD